MNPAVTTTNDVNLAVVRGSVPHEPTKRELPAGGVVVQFDVTTRADDGTRAATLVTPISWQDPPASAVRTVREGSEVVVIGTVRRRFFRVGGATQSRTEVVAERVISVRRRTAVDRAVADAVCRLQAIR